MPIFEIETPQGTFEVDAPDERSALRALSPQAQATGPGPAPSPSQGAASKQPEQSYTEAANTWLEHAISDLPIIGPALQGTSDLIGTEVWGRLSGQDPAKMREEIRGRREGRTEQYPMSAVSGMLGGNIAAFGGAGATAGGSRALGITGDSLLGRMLASGATGGSISAADTSARGGDASDIIGSGGIGMGIGTAIPAVGSLLKSGVSAVGDRLAPRLNALLNPTEEGTRRVGAAIGQDTKAGTQAVMNQADESVAREAGIPILNVDRGGETTRALARSVANQSPEARAAIEKTASDRFSAQGDRAVKFVQRLAGGNIDDIGYRELLRESARAANRPAYQAAERSPYAQAMWNEGFEQLMQAPAMQAAARQATTRGANRAAVEGFTPVKNPFTTGPDGRLRLARKADGSVAYPNLQFWDQVKRNLDGTIGKAERAGDRTLAADLKALRGSLIDMTDAAVPEYRTARQGAAGFFGAEDAIEAGKKFATSPKLVPETRRAFERMTAAEKKAFQAGYASELIDGIKAAGDRTNVITKTFKSPAARESIELVFGPKGARDLEAYVRVEDIADRLRGALGNSTTARQLVELGLGGGAGYMTTGDWQGALTGAVAAKGARMVGDRVNQKVMTRIAEMLTSDDPRALDGAVKLAAQVPQYMQALEEWGRLLAAPSRGAAAAAQ